MNEEELVKYYNKFNEDKRLTTKHGQVEFLTALHYISEYLKEFDNPKIIDIGAGTGAYSIPLSNKGYEVTAIELVKRNLKVLEKNSPNVKCILGNAIGLKKIPTDSYDIVILFGPMYHLINKDDKIKSLLEAKRIVKKNGFIFISYCLNEYAVITHGIVDNHLSDAINNQQLDNTYHIISDDKDLYSFVRIEDINELNNICKLNRVKIVSQDGPTEYLKKEINKMTEEEFNNYFNYHLSTCESIYTLGAGRHVLDILKKDN